MFWYPTAVRGRFTKKTSKRPSFNDIAVPNRCELQLQMFQKSPNLAIVGGAIDEFEGTPSNVISHKSMPQHHGDILRYARMRNPFNHPTVMYRKSAVLFFNACRVAC